MHPPSILGWLRHGRTHTWFDEVAGDLVELVWGATLERRGSMAHQQIDPQFVIPCPRSQVIEMIRSTSVVLCVLFSVVASFSASKMSVAEELEIGAKVPEFKAVGTDGKEYSLDSLKGAKATVIAFTCNRCPVAMAYENRFIDFQKKYGEKGVRFLAINVNATEDVEGMKQRVEEKGINYPYAYDDSGDSARAFGARVTPHVFVIDEKGLIAYRGAFDDKQTDPTIPYVENAVNAVLEGKKPEVQSTKAIGCGIKPKKN